MVLWEHGGRPRRVCSALLCAHNLLLGHVMTTTIPLVSNRRIRIGRYKAHKRTTPVCLGLMTRQHPITLSREAKMPRCGHTARPRLHVVTYGLAATLQPASSSPGLLVSTATGLCSVLCAEPEPEPEPEPQRPGVTEREAVPRANLASRYRVVRCDPAIASCSVPLGLRTRDRLCHRCRTIGSRRDWPEVREARDTKRGDGSMGRGGGEEKR